MVSRGKLGSRDTQLPAYRTDDGRGWLGLAQDRRRARITADLTHDVSIGLGIDCRPAAYVREHAEIFAPMQARFRLVREIATAVMHEVGAFE